MGSGAGGLLPSIPWGHGLRGQRAWTQRAHCVPHRRLRALDQNHSRTATDRGSQVTGPWDCFENGVQTWTHTVRDMGIFLKYSYFKARHCRQKHCVYMHRSNLRFWAFWFFIKCCFRLVERKHHKDTVKCFFHSTLFTCFNTFTAKNALLT